MERSCVCVGEMKREREGSRVEGARRRERDVGGGCFLESSRGEAPSSRGEEPPLCKRIIRINTNKKSQLTNQSGRSVRLPFLDLPQIEGSRKQERKAKEE